MRLCGETNGELCPLDRDQPCACFRLEGHSLNYEHPHGCVCGALW